MKENTSILQQSGSTSPIRWGPYITGTTSESTSLHVWTDGRIPVAIEYCPARTVGDPGKNTRTASEMGGDNAHHIFAIDGLEPGTWYSYHVIAGEGEYGPFRFMTMPVSGPVMFAVYGDTRDELPGISQEERHRPVAEAIDSESGIAFVVHTGDMVHDGTNVSDWDRFFSTGQRLLANATFVPVIGNHEQNSPLYNEIFRTTPNYTVEAGDALIAVIDSNDWAWNTLPAQSAWLREVLSRDCPWKFIAVHHPLYSSDEKHPGGYENLRLEWESLFRQYRVNAVFQGHVHVYERDIAHGVTYITEARGGAPWYALAEDKIPEYRMSSMDTLGYSVVWMDEDAALVHVRVMAVYPGSPGTGPVTIPVEQITLPSENALGELVPGTHATCLLLPEELASGVCCMKMSYAGKKGTVACCREPSSSLPAVLFPGHPGSKFAPRHVFSVVIS